MAAYNQYDGYLVVESKGKRLGVIKRISGVFLFRAVTMSWISTNELNDISKKLEELNAGVNNG